MKKIILLIVFYLFSLAAMGRTASHFTAQGLWSAFELKLEAMQAELSLRHLERYEELERDLAKGCPSAVSEKLRISAAFQRSLIAGALKRQSDDELYRLVDEHSPGLAQGLTDYKSPYGSAWKEPACE